jgi:hypothetical protein
MEGHRTAKKRPAVSPLRKVSLDKSPANTGVVKDSGTLSENFENLSGNPPTQEGFSENGQKVSLGEKSVPQSYTTPLRWTEDGVEWEYITEEESE